MENFEVLSPGKKIRKIRKDFRIKQHEITGGEITRNLISIIENDKANLTIHVADILSENINKVCAERKIDFRVTSEYLLEDINVQVNQIADNYIDYLFKNECTPSFAFEDSLNNIENFLSKYDIFDKKVVIFEKIGCIYRNHKEYYKAYTYYLKAYEHNGRLLDDVRLARLLLDLNYCCVKLNRYKEVLGLNKSVSLTKQSIPIELRYKLLFNNILAYKNLGEYDKAVIEIERVERDFSLSTEYKFDLTTIKANCLMQNKHYKEALSLHEYLFSLIENDHIEKKLIALCNILEIYTILNDTKYLKKYLAKSNLLVNEYDLLQNKKYDSQIYNYIGIGYHSIDDLDSAKEYFNKSVKAAATMKNASILLSSLDNLFDIYVKENNSNELDNLKTQLLELISLETLPANNTLILKLIGYYNDSSDKESIRNLIYFVLNNSK